MKPRQTVAAQAQIVVTGFDLRDALIGKIWLRDLEIGGELALLSAVQFRSPDRWRARALARTVRYTKMATAELPRHAEEGPGSRALVTARTERTRSGRKRSRRTNALRRRGRAEPSQSRADPTSASRLRAIRAPK